MSTSKWKILSLAALMTRVSVPGIAAETVPEANYQTVNVSLTQQHIVPRYQRLAAATQTLDNAARSFCKGRNADSRVALEERYNQAMDAWMGVQHIQFGAVELFMRQHRLFFGPDHRGHVAAQLEKLLAGRDRKVLEPESFRNASAALQGFPALEQLLFGDEAAKQPPSEEDLEYRCTLIVAITQNLAAMAAGILRDWQAGDRPFAMIVASPGPDNAYYQSPQEATLDFFKSLHGGLQFIADIKLKPVLGESLDLARPRRAESWRSGRSLRNIVVNLEALAALYLGEGGTGLTEIVQSYGNDPKLDPLMRKAFMMTLETARGIDASLDTAVRDPVVRPQVEKLGIQVLALKQIVKTRLASALDLAVGFNALDGD